ncbi:MAG: hypothetical protein ACTTKF_08625, partial [Bacteroides sp.]
FSKLKILQSSNFADFRAFFRAKLEKIFVVPADTFDNVKGAFPIGFKVWNTYMASCFESIEADVYTSVSEQLPSKHFASSNHIKRLSNQWIPISQNETIIGHVVSCPPDFQHNNQLALLSIPQKRYCTQLTIENLIYAAIYISVRHAIAPTWLNDRDQFLYPRDGWQADAEFQTDCLAFTLFHTQNRITATEGTNHWIPFTEVEVEAKDSFESHSMTQFIQGKLALDEQKGNEGSLFQSQSFVPSAPLVFSPEATAVFDAGRELWRYYHAQPDANPNASYYDIRVHFQGRNDKGKMNAKSEDAEYMRLLGNLKEAMEVLRQQIVPKVYEYGFLME